MKRTMLDDVAAILEERGQGYPPFKQEAERVCAALKILWGIELTPVQYTHVLMTMKLCREGNRHKRDNLIDLVGYSTLLDTIYAEASQARKAD